MPCNGVMPRGVFQVDGGAVLNQNCGRLKTSLLGETLQGGAKAWGGFIRIGAGVQQLPDECRPVFHRKVN